MADEVDRILAAWRAEAPDLDTEPLEILSRVTRLARHLDLARRDTFARHGLDVWEFDVLTALRREGPPYELSPGRLIHRTLSTSGTMTNRIDRLEERGLVERRRDPDDRRGVRVRLTAAGRERVERALADLLAYEREVLAGLDGAERRRLTASLRRLLSRFEEATGKNP
jgi:DNA-binding MarR family transcriptional regulator